MVVRSSTEAEYRPLAHIISELIWLESPLNELDIPFYTLTLLCDKLSVVLVSHNHVSHARTKRIEFDIHFIRERIIFMKLLIQLVPITAQIVDTLTKPLSTTAFQDLRSKLKPTSEGHPF